MKALGKTTRTRNISINLKETHVTKYAITQIEIDVKDLLWHGTLFKHFYLTIWVKQLVRPKDTSFLHPGK